MRKLLLSVLCLSAYFYSLSQEKEETGIARQLVIKNSAVIGLSVTDVQNSIVANTYKISGRNDLRMVYLQQSFKGIPVYNELLVLAFRNDQLVSNAGSRVPSIENKINTPDATPVLTVLNAVEVALRDASLQSLEQILPIAILQEGRKYEFGKLGVAVENIQAELLWLPIGDDKKEVRLAWQVFLAPINSSDYWLVRVDAMNGNIINKHNLTISCSWEPQGHSVTEHVKEHSQTPVRNYVTKRPDQQLPFQPFVVNSASYRVIPYPFESPNHLGSPSGMVNNPWLLAGGNATSLGWHNDGNADHDSTRGNNVWAAEDRLATNAVFERAAVSSTPGPDLTFDFTPDYTVAPTLQSPPNQQFGITNLFYWNNIMHDITYLYGFDEPAGNFQNNNQGRGGQQGDYVIADAQDGGGTNNANFATPVDGTRPRMQMFLWTAANPDRDGDLDNGIVAHEYTHGISNRLTGGPANSGCLGNAEHGGEGWSDYFALMVTTNWATATINDGQNPRAVGTYAANQPTSGSGIRNFRYSTNLAVNPLVYGTTIPSQVHNRGEYWCMALWEMTWEIIQQAGINPNLFAPANGGGNAIALKLVIEGMRLQPCNPGFIDARNAILRADTIFYGGQYSCAIWRAFAKRGMGRGASQGSSASVIDQTPSFIVDNGIFYITQSAPAVQEGQNVTYTNHVTAGVCSPITDAFTTDTLPTTVTWVSGGVYDAGTRTVRFGPINLATNQAQTNAFTVTVNPGTYFVPVEHFNETVPAASIPATWTIFSTSSTNWTASNVQSNSSPNAFFAPNPAALTDHRLTTAGTYTLNNSAASYSTLSFWHRFNTEDGWDGGVVEISTDGGSSWSDLGSKMIQNGYNGSLGSGSGNVLAGRQAFTGLTNSFIRTVVNLSSFAGQSIRIRFRFTTDDNTAPPGGGWYVDDIVLYTEPAVYMKSNMFTSSGTLLSRTDTVTRILPNSNCTPPAITTQPEGVTDCSGNNTSFAVAASGSAPLNYQWQVNTGSGFTDISNAAPYAGTTSATLTVSGLTTAMNGYQYRVVITNTCGNVTSAPAALTVTAVAAVNSQPVNTTVCINSNTSFSVGATGATGYQWQVNTGSGFVNILDDATFSGSTTSALTISGVTASMNNYQYRAVLSSCGPVVNSSTATLIVAAPTVVTGGPDHHTLCAGQNASFTVATSGIVTGYQWQLSTDGGSIFTNINGQTNATLNINNVTTAMHEYQYRVIVTGPCGSVNSIPAFLHVNPTPTFTLGNIPTTACVSDPALELIATGFTGIWSGNGVLGNMFTPSSAGVGQATITFTGTNNFGCSAAQSVNVTVNECPERHIALTNPQSLIIMPNPNGGNFRIWVRTDLYSRLNMRVYQSDGRLVATEAFTGVVYDAKLAVDLTRLASGVYHLLVYNDENGGMIKKSFKVVIAR